MRDTRIVRIKSEYTHDDHNATRRHWRAYKIARPYREERQWFLLEALADPASSAKADLWRRDARVTSILYHSGSPFEGITNAV